MTVVEEPDPTTILPPGASVFSDTMYWEFEFGVMVWEPKTTGERLFVFVKSGTRKPSDVEPATITWNCDLEVSSAMVVFEEPYPIMMLLPGASVVPETMY